MAESVIGITEGSGKFGHTFQRVIGANTVEDGVVLLGENYLAGYTFATGAPSTATASSHEFQLMAGATLKVRVRRIEIYQQALATAATIMDVNIVRLTSAGTGGTALTATPLDPTDAAAGATAMTLPTVKGTEATSSLWTGEFVMVQTLGASTLLAPALVIDFDRPRTKPLIIAAGVANGFAIKNFPGIAAGALRIACWFDESNF